MPRKASEVRTVRTFKRVTKLVPIVKRIVTAGPVYVAFGEIVRYHRDRRGLTQEALAKKVGLTRTSIVNIEQGRQRVLLDDLLIFAKALDVKPRTLFAAIESR